MKFTIKEEEEEKKEDIGLWIERGTFVDGNVNLWGIDKDGFKKAIMTFKDGEFYRQSRAHLKGLETDERGRIKEQE